MSIKYLLFILFFSPLLLKAQHCPWDCSGMILLDTRLSGAEFEKLEPVLVDRDKKIVIDTVYGTGVDSFDSCYFLSYADFTSYRTKRIQLHYWYKYDTLYHFAAHFYLVRYNYCRFGKEGNTDLMIRFRDPDSGTYRYIDIPVGRRIHLHNYNMEIRKGLGFDDIPSLEARVLRVDRKEWNLPDR